MEYRLVMPYIGGILSKNNSKWPGGRGFKPQVKKWMKDLEEVARDCNIPKASRYEIRLKGFFSDERRPDLANLHEVIGDALKRGIGVDDKFFDFTDEGCEFHLVPYLGITVTPKEV